MRNALSIIIRFPCTQHYVAKKWVASIVLDSAIQNSPLLRLQSQGQDDFGSLLGAWVLG